MGELLKILTVIAASSVKLAVGSLFAVGFGYNFWQTWLLTTLGGSIGVIVFTEISRLIWGAWDKKKASAQVKDVQQNFLSKWLSSTFKKNTDESKPVFTKRSRFIIRWKKQYGLVGLAFLTPIVLTIPIGTFISNRFFADKKIVMLYLTVSTVLWAALLALMSGIRDGISNFFIKFFEAFQF